MKGEGWKVKRRRWRRWGWSMSEVKERRTNNLRTVCWQRERQVHGQPFLRKAIEAQGPYANKNRYRDGREKTQIYGRLFSPTFRRTRMQNVISYLPIHLCSAKVQIIEAWFPANLKFVEFIVRTTVTIGVASEFTESNFVFMSLKYK